MARILPVSRSEFSYGLLQAGTFETIFSVTNPFKNHFSYEKKENH